MMTTDRSLKNKMSIMIQMEGALAHDKFGDLNLATENEEVVEEIGAFSDAAPESDEE